MIIALSFNVSISQQKERKHDDKNIPSRKNQSIELHTCIRRPLDIYDVTHVKVSATEPIFSGAYQAENATIAGIWSKQTCRAYADPISMLRKL